MRVAAAGGTARARFVAALGGLLGVCALVLAPVLAAGFEYDDRADAIDNPAARPETFLGTLGTTNRPLVKASYALQRWATGDDPRPFHAANLALHLAATIAVFLVVRRFAGVEGLARDLAAWLAAATWALHPAAVEAVAPVVGRSTLLSTLLMLLALLLVTGTRAPSRGASLAAAALAAAAPLARETALVLPALGFLWQATLGGEEERRAAFRRQIPLVAGAAAAAVAIALSPRHRELVAFSLATRAPLDSLRGNLPALAELLALWAAPWRVSVDPSQPPELPWLSPPVLASAAIVAAAAALVVAFRRRRPRVALAIGWTLVALVPSNSIVWRLDPVAPRALYPASIGLVLLLALAVVRSARVFDATSPSRTRVAAAAAGLLLVALPLAAEAREARRRADLWTQPAALWADAAGKAPEKARPWLNLGIELMLAGRLEAAEAALARAARLDPAQSNARCALDALRVRMAAVGGRERSFMR